MSHLKASAAPRISAPSPTPSSTSASGAKRKRPEEINPSNIVYSQPQETGTGSHIYTQLTYTIDHLRSNQRWMSFEEIMDYLNVKKDDQQTRTHLRFLFRADNPQNRIAYNAKDDTYRYKPKYDIRNAAQLKGHFQHQKSAQGLSVKDLKDGWTTVQEDIKTMEDKKEVLVKRNQKDGQARTVWGNDASLEKKMDPEFGNEWHKIPIPANPDDLRNSLLAAGLKPSSAPREASANKPKEKKRKAPRRGGKQTNTHMVNILKDFSHLRK